MAKHKPKISLVRAYDLTDDDTGYRVLVDRLWPRGVSKQRLQLDEWLKDIAPSAELRRWFGHAPERWAEFQKRYKKELTANRDVVAKLASVARQKPVVLVYAARDVEHNDAVVLRDYLLAKLRRASK